ncbi:MAG: hypothetical protein EZS28_037638 [Streblomastix strix]|uniref:Uncharacterized protein n=1 Tax=Streblomastix strix TaxID=222440 RepID=A0A5J4UB00_9EUKA|nr:MAG: hypothetical protein EZS28_037638 [Streblomastix strix]
MIQIRGGTNDILINETIKHLAIYGLINASYGAGITCRQSMTKSKLWNKTGKNHVGYQGMAKVINIALMFENDIILYRLPLSIPKLLNGKLEDYDLNT